MGGLSTPNSLRTRARKKRRISNGAQRKEVEGTWNPHERGTACFARGVPPAYKNRARFLIAWFLFC